MGRKIISIGAITSQFTVDAESSSSVGFKGEGGLLTGIDTG